VSQSHTSLADSTKYLHSIQCVPQCACVSVYRSDLCTLRPWVMIFSCAAQKLLLSNVTVTVSCHSACYNWFLTQGHKCFIASDMSSAITHLENHLAQMGTHYLCHQDPRLHMVPDHILKWIAPIIWNGFDVISGFNIKILPYQCEFIIDLTNRPLTFWRIVLF